MAQDLYSLLSTVGIKSLPAHKSLLIQTIGCDSRTIGRGGLFFGLPGQKVDGGSYWREAMRSGAVAAVISETAAKLDPPKDDDVVFIVSESIGYLMGEMASAFWEQPSQKMDLIGVTGTNGKTTTSFLIEHLSSKAGMPSALFSTLFNRWPEHSEVANHTTAFGDVLQLQLFKAVLSGARLGVMEVSSHALEQRRVAGCRFSGAIFTNLSQDHLDYHKSMEAYFEAKTLLFHSPLLHKDRFCSVINIDNPWGYRLSEELNNLCWRASLDNKLVEIEKPELFFTDLSMNHRGCTGQLHSPNGQCAFASPLLGKFNLMNLLEAVGILLQHGFQLEQIVPLVSSFPGVPGRMEQIKIEGEAPDVIVDYAHTPDGLKNALITLLPSTIGSLYCVFGCGGDRDREKRSLMGAIASKFADKVIITSDNPRTEDPHHIINDILKGISTDTELIVESNREVAIQRAIASAMPGDMVLIAGKGHEDYQIIGTNKIQFDDREIARQALGSRISR